jgi:phage virion morphogenesis protein
MVSIVVELDDLDAQARLRALDAALGDLTPLMDQIGALLEQSARDRIEATNMTPTGVPWPPSLRAQIAGGRTLLDTGRLAASLTHRAGRREAEVGTNVLYARTHQLGATIRPKAAEALSFVLANGQRVSVGKVTIPARPFLGTTGEVVGTIGSPEVKALGLNSILGEMPASIREAADLAATLAKNFQTAADAANRARAGLLTRVEEARIRLANAGDPVRTADALEEAGARRELAPFSAVPGEAGAIGAQIAERRRRATRPTPPRWSRSTTGCWRRPARTTSRAAPTGRRGWSGR